MDISARLVSLLAWPIQKTLEQDQTTTQLRRRAAARPADVATALDADLLRTAAWMLALLLTVPVAVVLSLVDGALPATAGDVAWTVVQGLVVGCTLLGTVHAVRAAIAAKSGEEQWAARRRWIVPGNAEVIVVILLVLAGIAAAVL